MRHRFGDAIRNHMHTDRAGAGQTVTWNRDSGEWPQKINQEARDMKHEGKKNNRQESIKHLSFCLSVYSLRPDKTFFTVLWMLVKPNYTCKCAIPGRSVLGHFFSPCVTFDLESVTLNMKILSGSVFGFYNGHLPIIAHVYCLFCKYLCLLPLFWLCGLWPLSIETFVQNLPWILIFWGAFLVLKRLMCAVFGCLKMYCFVHLSKCYHLWTVHKSKVRSRRSVGGYQCDSISY